MNLYSSFLRYIAIPAVLKKEKQFSALNQFALYMKSQYWTQQELLDYQWEQLRTLLEYAYANCPYYTDLFNRLSLTPASFKTPDDISQLPILTRDDIYEHRRHLISRQYQPENLFKFYTGGTTGQQASMYLNQESFNKKLAIAWRFEQWMGKEIPDKMVYFWPASMDIVERKSFKAAFKQRYIMRQVVFHAGGDNPSLMRKFYDDFVAFKPKFIKAFPSSLYCFAEYLEREQLSIPSIKGIMSTGEVLYPQQRAKFESVFQTHVFDMYGSREVGNTSGECEHHTGLHIASEISYVEYITDNRPANIGEEGSIIITDLTNFGMPIIRYQINDYGIPVSETCSCGRNLPLMSSTKGRLEDYFWGPDGTKYNGNVLGFHISTAEDNVEIGQIQFIQKSLTHFHVRITNRPEPTPEVFSYIKNKMREIIDPGLEITIEVVDNIPAEKSGKTRYVICEIPPP